MKIHAGSCRPAALAFAAVLLNASLLHADSVTLNGGGTVKGVVTTGSKSVNVRTSTGAVIVFDRATVKHVTHGHSQPGNATNAKAEPKKRRLTSGQEAWTPKVRALVSRLYGGDRDRSRQARSTLLHLDDSDAIPALSTHLGSRPDGDARHLYVVILRNIKGPQPVYYLVTLSLFDRSPAIRAEARQAIREDQLESARLLYVAALRTGWPPLVRGAAIALGEIGDPRGDSIPYLINALVSYGTIASLKGSAQYGVLYTVTGYQTPGLKFGDAALASSAGNAAASDARQSDGGKSPQDVVVNSSRMPVAAPMLTDVYEQPIVAKSRCSHDHPLEGYLDHPEVLDALLKITDQAHPGYGFNQDRWRSWWTAEKANRDLQKLPIADRVLH